MLVGFGYLIRVKQTGQILLVFEVKSNERVDNNSRPHGIRTRYSSYFTLQADTYYPILAYFGERTGGDAMLIRWQGPGQGYRQWNKCLFSITI